jgi:mannose-1-phosphate guanylyltransferase
MSTPECPKQFVDVLGTGRTFIQMTVDRFKELMPAENVWVVTSQAYREQVMKQLPEVPAENILLEPCRRNTAPCIAYASWRIKSIDPKATIVVSPSDHLILDVTEFRRVVSSAVDFASTSDAIITLGMKPTRPETGYGYIQTDMSCPSVRNKEIYRVDAFKEKPDLSTAEKYIRKPNMLWNAGIFIWNVSTIVNAFRVYSPEISHIFEDIYSYYDLPQEQDMINQVFPQCENISVDYAIMEKAEEIFVYPAEFGWSDLGTWNSLRQHSNPDKYGNAIIGQNVDIHESHNSIIHTTGLKKVVIQGIEDCIIAEKDGTLLICKISDEERIRLFH